MEQRGILCIGSIMVDVVCPIEKLPKAGEGLVLEQRRWMLGGCAFNTANVVRQLGGKCTLLAPVGRGPIGCFVADELRKRNMEPYYPALGDSLPDSGMALCLREPDGERTMLTLPGIERCFKPEWLDAVDASEFGIVEVCGYEVDGAGGDAIVGFAEAHPGLEFWFAPGPCIARIAPERMERIRGLHAIWHLNDMEALSYTRLGSVEAAGTKMAKDCGNVVIITDGARGAHAFVPHEAEVEHIFAPTNPITPVDTIGAGDSHVGAIMAARTQGATWREALAKANQVSGIICTIEGATIEDSLFRLP